VTEHCSDWNRNSTACYPAPRWREQSHTVTGCVSTPNTPYLITNTVHLNRVFEHPKRRVWASTLHVCCSPCAQRALITITRRQQAFCDNHRILTNVRTLTIFKKFTGLAMHSELNWPWMYFPPFFARAVDRTSSVHPIPCSWRVLLSYHQEGRSDSWSRRTRIYSRGRRVSDPVEKHQYQQSSSLRIGGVYISWTLLFIQRIKVDQLQTKVQKCI